MRRGQVRMGQLTVQGVFRGLASAPHVGESARHLMVQGRVHTAQLIDLAAAVVLASALLRGLVVVSVMPLGLELMALRRAHSLLEAAGSAPHDAPATDEMTFQAPVSTQHHLHSTKLGHDSDPRLGARPPAVIRLVHHTSPKRPTAQQWASVQLADPAHGHGMALGLANTAPEIDPVQPKAHDLAPRSVPVGGPAMRRGQVRMGQLTSLAAAVVLASAHLVAMLPGRVTALVPVSTVCRMA